MTNASCLPRFGIAATGILNESKLTGSLFVVVEGCADNPDDDAIKSIIGTLEIAPDATIRVIVVDEKEDKAAWVALPQYWPMQAEPMSLARLEMRLNREMFAARPLLGARLHCMVALQYGHYANPSAAYDKSDQALNEEWMAFRSQLRLKNRQFETTVGRNYYLPHLHPLLVPGTPGSDHAGIITLRSSSFRDQKIICSRDERGPVQGKIEDVFLHIGPERTLLLEWVTVLDAAPYCHKKTELWRAILANGVDGPDRSLAAWLNFSESVRTCYSSYRQGEAEPSKKAVLSIKCGDSKPRDVISLYKAADDEGPYRAPIIGLPEYFLRGFIAADQVPELNAILEFRFDHRARVIQSILVAGDEVPDDAANARERAICEARLLGVDKWQDDFPYEETISRRETYAHAYDRYRGMGSRYLLSDHSFAYIGHGEFPAETFWPKYLRHLYPPMVRLLHMNGAILNGFSRELVAFGPFWRVEAPNDPEVPHPLASRFSALRGRYLRFLALNWFEQVSSQMQGVELYDLLRNVSHAQRELQIVGDSIERAEAFFDQQARDRTDQLERRKEDMVRFVAVIVPVLGLGGLILSMLTVDQPSGLARLLQDWVNARLIHAAGETGAQTWAYEIAGYTILVALLSLGAFGVLRTPLPEFIPGEKRPSRFYFLPAAVITLMTPFLTHAMWASDARIVVLLLCTAAVAGLSWAALPDARQGGRKARKAIRWLATGAITALTLIAGWHAALIC